MIETIETNNNTEKVPMKDDKQTLHVVLPSQTKKEKIWDYVIKSVNCATAIVASIFSVIATTKVSEVYNILNQQNQTQNQTQTQVVIEPREGDIIVKDGDDYKLLQLINSSDILFPSKVQEIRHSYKDSNTDKRVEIKNEKGEDWSKKDSFSYMINNFSINPNKIINLLDNISGITIFCDFYEQKNIASYVDLEEKNFVFNMMGDTNENHLKISNLNLESEYEYVTDEINNGIEWVKIRVEIVYKIEKRTILDSISSDWIPTDADFLS